MEFTSNKTGAVNDPFYKVAMLKSLFFYKIMCKNVCEKSAY